MKLFLVIATWLTVLFISFTTENKRIGRIIPSGETSVDSIAGTSPYFTKDNKGNKVLSWVRIINDSSAIFCYAVFNDEVKSFGKTITIPSSGNIHPHSGNLPKVIFKPSGEIIAVWGEKNPNPFNRYAGLIFYSQSFDNGSSWTPAQALVSDTSGYDQRYSDIALLKNGEAAIIWLDNRKTTNNEGSALYCAVTKGKNGFRNETIISQPACPCCRTSVFVDSKNNIHALYRGILNDSIRDMVHVVSADGGKTFSAPKRINNDNWMLRGCPHTGPSMTENDEGMHFVWFTGGLQKGSFYIWSENAGKTYLSHDNISRLGTHPQITALPGGELVTAWDESVSIGNQYYKRIGMQVRTPEGLKPLNKFITPDTGFATYPVVASVNNSAVLAAWTSRVNEKDYVKWQLVNFER